MSDLVHGAEVPLSAGWTWSEPRHGEHFRRCSYCGSVHPDDLAAEFMWRAEWADRKYGWPHKFYVDIPNRDPGALFTIGSIHGGPSDRELPSDYIVWADLTDEQRALYERDHGPITEQRVAPRAVYFGTRPSHFGKFYTVHLADLAISPAVKKTIERRSGLHFEFTDGRMTWSATQSEVT